MPHSRAVGFVIIKVLRFDYLACETKIISANN